MSRLLEARAFLKTPFGVIATVVAVVASGYLYLVHKDHVLALLPYLFLALCPLMHMLMHRGHGHGHGSHDHDRAPDADRSKG